jgi:hypothetical protein
VRIGRLTPMRAAADDDLPDAFRPRTVRSQ